VHSKIGDRAVTGQLGERRSSSFLVQCLSIIVSDAIPALGQATFYGYTGNAFRVAHSIQEEGVVRAAAKTRKILGRVRAMTAIWEALHGPGKNPVETFEQGTVRRWLQGQA
jgi:hypothetical protein